MQQPRAHRGRRLSPADRHALGALDGCAQDGYPLVPGEAVWARVVDGLHDRLIEDVGVEVDPEPVRPAVTSQEGHSLAGSAFGARLADEADKIP